MPHLSRAQAWARQQILHLADRPLPPDRLGDALLAALHGAVHSDGQSLFGLDPSNFLYNRLLAGSGGMYNRDRLTWLQRVYLVGQSGENNHPGFMRAGLAAVAFHDRMERCWGMTPRIFATASAQEWHRAYHEEGKAPSGGVLVSSFAADGRWLAGLNMTRLDAHDAPFRPADVAFLRLVAPTIGRAFRAAFARERALSEADTPGPGASGVLVLGADGHVCFQTAAAESWIGLLQDTWQPEAPGKMQLPTAVWAAVAGARVGIEGEHLGIVHARTAAGPLRIEASPADGTGCMAVVLTPVRPPASPTLPADWPVTARERDVMSLVATGMSNRQVAERLMISEQTVITHLAHAYDKLGVHSRSELLARLFREAYWPTLRDRAEGLPTYEGRW
ncbi:MAG: helix-turn-helix transcriptional regulator [Terriglobales bacterium]